ncbi:hypothetical protein [Luteipulveratus mongoliensis]|uniref:Uncharacterized protein n=1 Tax=Luteipulveratus mongoliensis TaxID=571913 RepID=A0A0K1JGD8_9MICO|nr:hypothetical protein [Luteipulveratus mongoliensis]AKU15761.1 hypothetical protein VV02_07685 [Luteipulveratus mongoliensis]
MKARELLTRVAAADRAMRVTNRTTAYDDKPVVIAVAERVTGDPTFPEVAYVYWYINEHGTAVLSTRCTICGVSIDVSPDEHLVAWSTWLHVAQHGVRREEAS